MREQSSDKPRARLAATALGLFAGGGLLLRVGGGARGWGIALVLLAMAFVGGMGAYALTLASGFAEAIRLHHRETRPGIGRGCLFTGRTLNRLRRLAADPSVVETPELRDAGCRFVKAYRQAVWTLFSGALILVLFALSYAWA